MYSYPALLTTKKQIPLTGMIEEYAKMKVNKAYTFYGSSNILAVRLESSSNRQFNSPTECYKRCRHLTRNIQQWEQ